MPPVKQTEKIKAFAEQLRKWWRFSNSQQHEHSWHDREDFIERELPALLEEYCESELQELRAKAELGEALEVLQVMNNPTTFYGLIPSCAWYALEAHEWIVVYVSDTCDRYKKVATGPTPLAAVLAAKAAIEKGGE